jgi:hypothetical protein
MESYLGSFQLEPTSAVHNAPAAAANDTTYTTGSFSQFSVSSAAGSFEDDLVTKKYPLSWNTWEEFSAWLSNCHESP